MKENLNKKPKIDNTALNNNTSTNDNDSKIYNDYTTSRGSFANETEKWEAKVQKNSDLYKHAEKKGTTNLPAGFFDDHELDSKARGLMYWKPKPPVELISSSVLFEKQPTAISSTVIASAPTTVLEKQENKEEEKYNIDVDEGIEDIIINSNSIDDQLKLAEMEQTAYMMKIKEIYDKINKKESSLTEEDRTIMNELLGENVDNTENEMEEEKDDKEVVSTVSSQEITDIMKKKKKLRNEKKKRGSGINK